MKQLRFLILTTLTLIWLAFAQPALASSLTLSPSVTNTQVNQQFNLSLTLNPQNQLIVGTDIILIFDPAIIKPISVINTGHIRSTPAIRLTDTPGQLKFSLANPYGVYTTTPGTIATLTFEALKTGQTNLSFQFTPGNTRDTNIVSQNATDTLTTTNQAKITVSALQSSKSTSPTPTPTNSLTSTTEPILGTTTPSNRRILGDTDTPTTTPSATRSAVLALTDAPTPSPTQAIMSSPDAPIPTITGLTTPTDKLKQLLLLAAGAGLIALGTALAIHLTRQNHDDSFVRSFSKNTS
jgi:hypothetical protein